MGISAMWAEEEGRGGGGGSNDERGLGVMQNYGF